MVKVNRTGILITPDPARVLFRPFEFGSESRKLRILDCLLNLTDEQVISELGQVMADFGNRHQKIDRYFLRRFNQIKYLLPADRESLISPERQLLIGSYFSLEYSMESAALFNPCIVEHPDQTELEPGLTRFIMSLRATGEGHISSIEFRSGVINESNFITLDRSTRYVTSPETVLNPSYDKSVYEYKLHEMGILNTFSKFALILLSDIFSLTQLQESVKQTMQVQQPTDQNHETASGMILLAQNDYEIVFSPEQNISERIIFPNSPKEINGIEDARFVRFIEDDGSVTFYATYTAYNGRMIFPQLLSTRDFLHFRINALGGAEVQNKGLALFPRKLNGKYFMIGRQDGENLYIMESDNLFFWHEKRLLMKPLYPWEFVQLGNCGSPIETEYGWLVLSHGVGAIRKYSIGAFLLDINDPSKVIGRTKDPVITAEGNEREGYVPNVVYSCGGMLRGNQVIIPYAMSDYASSIATVELDELIAAMV